MIRENKTINGDKTRKKNILYTIHAVLDTSFLDLFLEVPSEYIGLLNACIDFMEEGQCAWARGRGKGDYGHGVYVWLRGQR